MRATHCASGFEAAGYGDRVRKPLYDRKRWPVICGSSSRRRMSRRYNDLMRGADIYRDATAAILGHGFAGRMLASECEAQVALCHCAETPKARQAIR